jgi:hypothetical protein
MELLTWCDTLPTTHEDFPMQTCIHKVTDITIKAGAAQKQAIIKTTTINSNAVFT